MEVVNIAKELGGEGFSDMVEDDELMQSPTGSDDDVMEDTDAQIPSDWMLQKLASIFRQAQVLEDLIAKYDPSIERRYGACILAVDISLLPLPPENFSAYAEALIAALLQRVALEVAACNASISLASAAFEVARRFYLAWSDIEDAVVSPSSCLFLAPHLTSRVFSNTNFTFVSIALPIERLALFRYPNFHKHTFSCKSGIPALLIFFTVASMANVAWWWTSVTYQPDKIVSITCTSQQCSYSFTFGIGLFYLVGDCVCLFALCLLGLANYRHRFLNSTVSYSVTFLFVCVTTNVVLAILPDIINVIRLVTPVSRGLQRLSNSFRSIYPCVTVFLYLGLSPMLNTVFDNFTTKFCRCSCRGRRNAVASA
ncbi:hypothetical protein TTRE_0000137301 [Trichuris trichiura]|uniref:G-protein coupled receptors family 1 profile domain-containing protein n=1 Tax=Trichuris trichiura TaxID=36087 RepID=A0A077Z341_TRITR|nr:hypothetical protein TTRE_0000137301 [Trichuris trichiura]